MGAIYGTIPSPALPPRFHGRSADAQKPADAAGYPFDLVVYFLVSGARNHLAALANSIIPALKWIALACAAGPLGDLATKAFWAIEKLVFG
jgi:hypothetical protein